MISIKDHGSLSELGQRNNNEDNFGILEHQVFIVCDGVGGAEKGEVASELVVNTFLQAFGRDAASSVDEVLPAAERKLTEYIDGNPAAMGMATTLTFSQIRADGVYVAWVGDSRIYQFRNGRIIFRTTDHSWVNEAVAAGIITPAEADNHPNANIITRAIQGLHKPTKADHILLKDIQEGDLFLHCSDGVLESWEDDELAHLFSPALTLHQILDNLRARCQQQSRDNFTAVVYQIGAVDINADFGGQVYQVVEAEMIDLVPRGAGAFPRQEKKVRGVFRTRLFGIPLYLFLLIALPTIYLMYRFMPVAIEKFGFSAKPETEQIEKKDPHFLPEHSVPVKGDSQERKKLEKQGSIPVEEEKSKNDTAERKPAVKKEDRDSGRKHNSPPDPRDLKTNSKKDDLKRNSKVTGNRP